MPSSRLILPRSPGEFWDAAEAIVRAGEIVVERPRGSVHSLYPDRVYPYDYGYIHGSSGSDGDEIDVWLGSIRPPRVTGVIVTLDAQKQDAEVKLLWGCSLEESREILEFHNHGGQRAFLITR